jgi:hypothetical protein
MGSLGPIEHAGEILEIPSERTHIPTPAAELEAAVAQNQGCNCSAPRKFSGRKILEALAGD